MAKVAIKFEKLTLFGGIFSILEPFGSKLSSTIDSTLGMRCELYERQNVFQVEQMLNLKLLLS